MKFYAKKRRKKETYSISAFHHKGPLLSTLVKLENELKCAEKEDPELLLFDVYKLLNLTLLIF